MVEESIDGSDAADGRRLPPNSPWLRVVSGTCSVGPVRCGCGVRAGGLRVANFWPRQKQGYAQADSTFCIFCRSFLQQKYMCNVLVARSSSARAQEHRAEAER